MVEHLTRDRPEGLLDLSETLVVVPTQNAGRLLRAALAAHAAEQGAGVLAPETLTPEALAAQCLPPNTAIASEAEAMAAWIHVLTTTPLEEVEALFPVPPPERDASWALTVAESLQRARAALVEGGLNMAAGAAEDAVPEPERWSQLAKLEAAYEAELARRGRVDYQSAQLAAQTAPLVWPWEGVTRLVLAAVPDPLPLTLELLHRRTVTDPACRLEILVWAPAEEAATFDAWGRPRRDIWKQREIALPPSTQVHPLADPAAQAERAASFLSFHESPASTLLPGLADPSLSAPLERAFRDAGHRLFLPEGTPATAHPFTKLLTTWSDLVRVPDWSAFVQWLRLPPTARAVKCGTSPERLLKIADDFYARHLPLRLEDVPSLAELDQRPETQDSMAAHEEDTPEANEAPTQSPELIRARHAATLAAVAQTVLQRRRAFTHRSLPEALTEWLLWMTGDREFSSYSDLDAGWMRLVRRAAELAIDIQEAWPDGERADQLQLLLKLLGQERLPTRRTSLAIEAAGWLELPWNDTPHLVLTGCNDAFLPAAPNPDPFLPDSLRETLGLRCHASREARDAFLLTALLHSREAAGRVDLLFGRIGSGEETLHPSRLLFRCADGELPRRVRLLLTAPPTSPPPPARAAWKLRPVATAAQASPTHLNVTSFSDYLACPFRFFLKHILKMRPVEPEQRELNARGFGTLCHQAFEFFALDETLRRSTDEQKIRDCLLAGLDQAVASQFGKRLPLSLLLQIEAARQRLRAAAPVQAHAVREGWVIAEVEKKLSTLRGGPYVLGGVEIRGQVDRLEINESLGTWRVVDYKTSSEAKNPRQHHLARLRDEVIPEWRIAPPSAGEATPRQWTNLQLPLYGAALAETMKTKYGLAGADAFQAAYFNLSQDLGTIGLEVWPGLEPSLLDSAVACASGIIAAIQRHEFWPPTASLKLDDLKDLWLGTPEETCEPPVILPE